MFSGISFAGCAKSDAVSTIADITTITLKNIVVDDLYVTKDLLIKFDWNIPTDWTFDTILHAQFKDNLFAGNVNYSKNIVSKIKIKKRFVGDFSWKTIYEKEINTVDDFVIEFYDYYEPSNRDIEYAYVAVISGIDSDSVSTSVRSEFDTYFICDKYGSYPMIIDTQNSVTYNRESTMINSPGKKYPYVISNGITKYYSGTLTTTFIELKDCDFDVKNGWNYRNQIDQILTDGRPKIIKSFEGDIWMVNITGSLPRTENVHYQNISHQIDWVECGNTNSIADLYDNGFIDTDVDRE